MLFLRILCTEASTAAVVGIAAIASVVVCVVAVFGVVVAGAPVVTAIVM